MEDADLAVRIAAAYDAVAPEYDALLARDKWMRRVLWRRYVRVFSPGQHVLDLGCGTGQDALFLAGRGIRVTALDASPSMVDMLAARLHREGLEEQIEARVEDIARLGARPAASVDGLISAFAGLNTVAEPTLFAAHARRVLRPGGRLIAHLLAPPSLWDRLRSPRASAEVWRRGERTIRVCGQPLRHLQLPARELYGRFFSADFRLLRAFALGFLLPDFLSGRARATVMNLLGRIEERIGTRRPFLNWGRFVVLELEARR
jgi:ubiquinone/menaquinone biosynthesis C-methylase UbiE